MKLSPTKSEWRELIRQMLLERPASHDPARMRRQCRVLQHRDHLRRLRIC
jgi:hypothetical protein